MIRSSTPSQFSRGCFSTGRKVIPTPYSPGPGSSKLSLSHSPGKKRPGHLEAELLALTGKEPVRNLNQHTRPIACFRIAAAGTAVRQVDQDLNALPHDGVTLFPTDAGHKTDTAGITLGRRVIETLRRRQTVVCLPMLQQNAPGWAVACCRRLSQSHT